MAAVDIKALSDEALVHHELQLERDLVRKNFAHATNQLEDTASVKKVRRAIARIRTEQRSRELANGLGKDALRNAHRASFKPDAAAAAAAPTEQAAGGFLAGIADKFGLGGDDAETAES
jgi:large subunit ribosomal protein L29